MKKLFLLYQTNAFFVNTIIFIFILSFIPINDINPMNSNVFFESIRIVQITITILFALFIYFILVRNSGHFNAFYISDKFYCDLMYLTTIVCVSLTIHYINWETTNVRHGIKIWEIAAYIVTLLYTFWLWVFKIGNKIYQIIQYKKITFGEKLKFILAILGALSLLLLIIIGHVVITFSSNYESFKQYSILFSITLIFFTYLLFDNISAKVIKLTSTKIQKGGNRRQNSIIDELNSAIEEYNEEFTFGLKYMDRPMKWVFLIMLVYATYSAGLDFFTGNNVMTEIEAFFGGAIAFELLLSSVVWAKTEKI